jgi:hypothetical protein
MRSKIINEVSSDVAFRSQREIEKQQSQLMIDTLWVDAWHFLVRPRKNVTELFKNICVELNLSWGAVSSNENIIHDARVSGDIDQYGFSDGFHITLNINFVGR